MVIAAITSCTNTSNPSVMIGAGLLARNALARGLKVKPWVKTSLSPGSRVVADYLAKSGLQQSLDALGYNIAGFGCMTCMGNSGALPAPVQAAIDEGKLTAVAVLSGNRNFEGRIHPSVRANFLASPPLVVAFAIAGTVLKDLENEPLGEGADGKPVYLRDIWPDGAEIRRGDRRSDHAAAVPRALRDDPRGTAGVARHRRRYGNGLRVEGGKQLHQTTSILRGP